LDRPNNKCLYGLILIKDLLKNEVAEDRGLEIFERIKKRPEWPMKKKIVIRNKSNLTYHKS